MTSRIETTDIGSAPVSVAGLERDTNIMGSNHALLRVRHLTVAQGRFLPEAGADKEMPVCVIGQKIRDELFGQQTALGQLVRVGDRRVRIIGVRHSSAAVGEQARALKDAGLDYYNHNIDTSPEHYGEIITTRTWQDRLDTLEHVRSAGMKTCCGGIGGPPSPCGAESCAPLT